MSGIRNLIDEIDKMVDTLYKEASALERASEALEALRANEMHKEKLQELKNDVKEWIKK